MQLKHEARLPWREREFISIGDAALIVGRSRTCVENLITAGQLDARRLPSGGPAVVTVASLLQYVDAAEPLAPRVFAATARTPLKLVVDNA